MKTAAFGDYSRQILDNLLEGCQLIDFEFRYLYLNKAIIKQSHKTKAELIGRTMMEAYPGIDQTEMFAHLRDCLVDRTPQMMENHFTFPNGQKGWFELRMEPVPQGVLIFSIDITERKKLELHLRELDSLKNKFINIVAHQIRTPSTVVRWSVENLLEGVTEPVTAAQTQVLQAIYQANNDIITRTDDMLMTIEIEEDRIKPQKTPLKLEKVLASVLQRIMEEFKTKNITLDIIYPAALLPAIQADQHHMRSVFDKLLRNALIYTPSGGTVTVSLQLVSKAALRFAVKDTGVGIPKADQAAIPGRFVRASNASAVQPNASGLGLFVADYLIRAHGGHLGFISRKGRGSTFWFELPVKA